MKITVQSEFGKGEIDNELELKGDVPFEVMEAVNNVVEMTIGTFKIAFLFYVLEKMKDVKIEADEELKEFLQAENTEDDGIVY